MALDKMCLCPSCKSDDVLSVKVRPSAVAFQFNICRSCENRWWVESEEAQTVPLQDVLDVIAV